MSDASAELEAPGFGIGPLDLHLFGEGTHRHLWHKLGAHPESRGGTPGVRFAVWAPRARAVSVVGDFCEWDGSAHPLVPIEASGIRAGFVPGAATGALYKFEIETPSGRRQLKTDPFAFAMEHPPATASRVFAPRHAWGDAAWMGARAGRDPLREPLHAYEMHLGSWQRGPGGRLLRYEEIAERLIPHLHRFGFTHVELMPITEHPFAGSWGYQVSGYFAPTARFGDPDGFRRFVDLLHQAGIAVLLDWVPAHFPRDDFALRRFDGEPLYEYADPRLGEHPDWGTLVFDFGRPQVRNFLIASALFWLEEYHLDGLRVDAVASMLYRDYSRNAGEWIPNERGGRENLEAVTFLRGLNEAVRDRCPGAITVAEESTAWPGVTAPIEDGGLGFTFKWNLGWMHDTLVYLGRDPVHRRHHQDQLSFAALYEHSEHFLMPLSHDEVVHGKGSLLGRMPGDDWQRFANLRCLLGYQVTRPGKQLLFMGTELAPEAQWQPDGSLDLEPPSDPLRAGLAAFLESLGRLYASHPALWRCDPDPDGFAWIDCSDRDASVFAYRRGHGADTLVVVLHLTPIPRPGYRIGVPSPGSWTTILDSDARPFGGSGFAAASAFRSEPEPFHGCAQSLVLTLPPLAILVLESAADG